MIERDLMDIIAEFYGDQYHGHPRRPNVDGNAPLLALLSRLHERVFPDYSLDPEQVLAGGPGLRGNSRVVITCLCVFFSPATGALVLFTGSIDGG